MHFLEIENEFDHPDTARMFKGKLQKITKCPFCKHESLPRDEVFNSLSLSLPNNEEINSLSLGSPVDLNQLLQEYFKTYTLDEDNKADCNNCNTKRQLQINTKISSLPDTLILHLKRF